MSLRGFTLPSLRRTNPWRREERPLLWAHRGYSAKVTENTLEAFRAAREAGADGVELDVRLCGSGELIVFHDDDLLRLAGRPERIGEMDFAAVRDVRLDGGHGISTLDEVFAAVGPDLLVNVEIKSPGLGRAGAVVHRAVDAIERSGNLGRVLVSSFDPFALLQVKRHQPLLSTAFLFHKGEPQPVRRAWVAPLFFPRAVHPEHLLCDAAAIRNWHRIGWAVNVWTVDQPARLRVLAEMGIDGVFANDVENARNILG
jgi:glycerophosphoryl diester phosphodiesterase